MLQTNLLENDKYASFKFVQDKV